VILGVLVLLLVATLAEPAQAVVRIRGVSDYGGRWRPRRAEAARGERVVWRAVSGDHDVLAYGGNWTFFRDLPQGTSVSRRFRSRGTYRFYCSIHGTVVGGVCDGMCGRVVVG
jgi:plastocyanin